MKLYVVTADTYDCEYGAEISLFGVYTDLEKAKQRTEQLANEFRYYVKITEIDSDTACEQYLGGYVEQVDL